MVRSDTPFPGFHFNKPDDSPASISTMCVYAHPWKITATNSRRTSNCRKQSLTNSTRNSQVRKTNLAPPDLELNNTQKIQDRRLTYQDRYIPHPYQLHSHLPPYQFNPVCHHILTKKPLPSAKSSGASVPAKRVRRPLLFRFGQRSSF